jgi:YD repeat-containing protein
VLSANAAHGFQEAATMPPKKGLAKSDREKARLLGPVRECTEKRTRPAVPGLPEAEFTNTREYDTEGRVVKTVTINQDGSKWVSANTYDEYGRLVKTTTGQESGPVDETTYQYDEKGRMAGYAGRGSRNETTRFEYSEDGRKTRVVTSTQPPSPDGPYGKASMLLSLEFGEDLYFPTPLGGAVKTVYDENDHPTELQVYVAGGRLVERLVRTYDSVGRTVETKAVMEDISATFPDDFAKGLLNQPGAAEELKRQLSELLGPQQEFGKITYAYDSEGRVTESHSNFGPQEEIVTKFIYNNQGDKIEERTTSSGNPLDAANASTGPHATGVESSLAYVYKYDSYGNWIEQATQSKSLPDGALQNAGICRRTITYY